MHEANGTRNSINENTQTECNLELVGALVDYKLYCFNGEPKFLYVGSANIINGKKHDLLSFYELNWERAPFYRLDHEQFPYSIEQPKQFEVMLQIARELSRNIPFIRVDLYYINQLIYFSELTFYPGSGFGKFYPDEWEKRIGSWIKLPLDKRQ